MGRCALRPRIENRRNFEEKGRAGAASGRRHATRTPSSLSRRGKRGGLDGRRIWRRTLADLPGLSGEAAAESGKRAGGLGLRKRLLR